MASARSSSSVASSPRFSPHRSRNSRSGHAAIARIVPNSIAVAKGRNTAKTPMTRPAKSRSRMACSRSCVVPVEAAAPALSFSDRGSFALASGHLLIHSQTRRVRDTKSTPRCVSGSGTILIDRRPVPIAGLAPTALRTGRAVQPARFHASCPPSPLRRPTIGSGGGRSRAVAPTV